MRPQISPAVQSAFIQAAIRMPLKAASSSKITNPAAQSSQSSLITAPAASADKRPAILVIDDEPVYLELITDILGDDYKILVADEGMTGLELATNNVPQLILLDLMMPGIDGFELYGCLK